MTPIDYENLFIYMSLIFAFCIFIILLYGCAFSGYTITPRIFENFAEKAKGKDDMKEQILLLLNDLKSKDTTTENDKNDLDIIIKTFSSSNVNVNDLVGIINQLKRFDPVKEKATPPPPPPSNNDTTSSSSPTQKPASSPTAPSTTTTAQIAIPKDPID